MKNIEKGQSNNTYEAAPEEWKEFFCDFRNIRKDVLTCIFKLNKTKQDEYLGEIREKELESFSSVDNPHDYLVYHISIGSSVGPLSAPSLDFDAEHSLMDFYKQLQEELK